MDTAILVSIVAALSALCGVALTAYVQLRNQRTNQRFQLDIDAIKHTRKKVDRNNAEAAQRIVEAHKLLSKISREFSITTLDILWRSKMTDSEYDLGYLSTCDELDQLRAFADLYEPTLMSDIEQLYTDVNIFWGHFKNILYQTSIGNKIDHTHGSLASTHSAANEVSRKTTYAKGRLTKLMRQYAGNK